MSELSRSGLQLVPGPKLVRLAPVLLHSPVAQVVEEAGLETENASTRVPFNRKTWSVPTKVKPPIS
ncbi:hypothetical protein [Streptomyces cyanogenus]|uniref:hypothetical protein n=1 Tax=Streptomyces cyanogenus TaxID=80860 RepID=UPI001AA1D3DB|nr:hypothetical protein [Streptomyces cyanogenus]